MLKGKGDSGQHEIDGGNNPVSQFYGPSPPLGRPWRWNQIAANTESGSTSQILPRNSPRIIIDRKKTISTFRIRFRASVARPVFVDSKTSEIKSERVCVSGKWNVRAIAISVENSIRDVAPVRPCFVFKLDHSHEIFVGMFLAIFFTIL